MPVEATELVSDAMERFFDPDATPRARMSSLRGAGLEFFDAAPQLFKDVFWRLADQAAPPAICSSCPTSAASPGS